MSHSRLRHALLLLFVLVGAAWSLAAAASDQKGADAYPNAQLVATAGWLQEHRDEVLLVDVRTDEYYDNTVIPGAVRLPWSRFRHDAPDRGVTSTFVGVARAAEILGQHGITRTSHVVLYDSVARDGGATASYVFWVLDVLGHEQVRVLDGGIDAWKAAGGEITGSPRTPQALDYAFESTQLRPYARIDGTFVHNRLGDPHYTIIDVRSDAEYRGKKTTKGISDAPLKRGHVPTAYNIDYRSAWVDTEHKRLASLQTLQRLYAGIDASDTIIVYCNSGRRSSYSYYVLRVLGYARVITYENSWKEWGEPRNFFPVETTPNVLPEHRTAQATPSQESSAATTTTRQTRSQATEVSGDGGGGYVSCGG